MRKIAADRQKLARTVLFFSFIMVVAACQTGNPEPIASSIVTATATSRIAAPSHTPYPTATPQPISEAQMSPTLQLADTPLPPLPWAITARTVDQIAPLAVWGNGAANAIALSPDGQILAVATHLGAFFYDSMSFAQLSFIQTDQPVRSIAFSADLQWIALTVADGSLMILEAATFSAVDELTYQLVISETPTDHELHFSNDSQSLTLIQITPSKMNITRWSVAPWEWRHTETFSAGHAHYIHPGLDLVGVIQGQDLALHSLVHPGDSELLDLPSKISPTFWSRMVELGGEIVPAGSGEFLIISDGASIVHWDFLASQFTYLLDHYPQAIADPCQIAPPTCETAQGAYAWTCEPDQPIAPIDLVQLTPDDMMMLISRNDGIVEFRQASNSVLVWRIDNHFTEVVFSPGSEFFFGLTPGGNIEKRSTLDGALLDVFDRHPDQLNTIAISPRDHIIAAGFNHGWIQVFDLSTGQNLGVLNGSATALAFSPDGSLLAAGLSDGRVRIFALDQGSYSDVAPGHQAEISDVTFSSSGDKILTASRDCTASLWQTTGKRIWHITPGSENPYRITDAALPENQTTTFYAGGQGEITVVDGSDSSSILLSENEIVTSMALSTDNKLLAGAGTDLWLIAHLFSRPIPHRYPLEAAGIPLIITFNHDGSLIIVTTTEEMIFWSPETTKVLFRLDLTPWLGEHSRPVSLVVSPDGRLIALGVEEGLIYLLGIPGGA